MCMCRGCTCVIITYIFILRKICQMFSDDNVRATSKGLNFEELMNIITLLPTLLQEKLINVCPKFHDFIHNKVGYFHLLAVCQKMSNFTNTRENSAVPFSSICKQPTRIKCRPNCIHSCNHRFQQWIVKSENNDIIFFDVIAGTT